MMFETTNDLDWYGKITHVLEHLDRSFISSNNVPNQTSWTAFLGELSLFLCVLFGLYFLFLRPGRAIDGAQQSALSLNSSESFKPKVSIHLNQTLLNKKNDDSYEWINDSILPFLELCSKSELHAFAEVETSEDEKKIKERLCQIHASDKGFKLHRLMFSSTSSGRGSMVRQLQPFVHIDANSDVVQSLVGKIPNIFLLNVRESNSDIYDHFSKGFESLRECLEVIYALPTL